MRWPDSVTIFSVISVIICLNCIDSQSLVDDEGIPKYSVGSALRFLSKSVFTKALLKDGDTSGNAEIALRSAHLEDSSDCVKRLICELQKKQNLTWDEKLIRDAIPRMVDLDYSAPTLQFHIAAHLGRNKGVLQCGIVYNRCLFNAKDIMELMRQRGTSLEIKTGSEYECTVLFLWNKKSGFDEN